MLIQAGASPRGIKASAYFAEHVFGAGGAPLKVKVAHRQALDAELRAQGRDPESVGILWGASLIVGETEQDALARRERLLQMIPREGVGPYLSHNIGYDFSKLPARFTLAELNKEIAARQASPVGLVHQLAVKFGEKTEMTREEFFEHGLKNATGYDRSVAGTAEQVADQLEEVFEATGSRGGFMFAHPNATPRDLLNVVDFLAPELRRRGRFRSSYDGTTLRENMRLK